MTERRTRKAQTKNSLELRPIGVICSKIKERSKAPKQGSEGAPDVWLDGMAAASLGERVLPSAR
jgi:hypothetical protein